MGLGFYSAQSKQFINHKKKQNKMETLNFSVAMQQTNKNGLVTFEANCKSIKVTSVKDLTKQIVEFITEFNELVNKKQSLGIKGLNSVKVKKSQPINLTLSFEGETVTVKYANFGKILETISKDNLTEIIELDVNFAQKFSHLWS